MAFRRKRLLYLSNSYPATVSGVTTVVTNLLRWMKPYYQVAVICPNTKATYLKKTIQGIPHYFLPSYPTLVRKDVRFITPNPLQLQKVFADFCPDLIHLHDPSPASLVLRDLALKNKVPLIFSHHFTPQMVLGYLPDSVKLTAQNSPHLNQAILRLSCKIYHGATRLIVPTQTVKNSLSPLTKIPLSVISSGIDCTPLPALPSKYHLPNSPFALYVGRLDPEKNLEVLLKAWSHLYISTRAFRLVIAGDGGSTAKLKSLAHELGLSRQITWTGLIPSSDLSLLYHHPQARVFVMPSPIESQSITTLMAAAAGLPIVAANAGALPEIVINHQNGYLCSADSPTAFAAKLKYLLENPVAAQKLGRFSSKIAKKHDFPLVINQYLKLYETLLLHHHSHA